MPGTSSSLRSTRLPHLICHVPKRVLWRVPNQVDDGVLDLAEQRKIMRPQFVHPRLAQERREERREQPCERQHAQAWRVCAGMEMSAWIDRFGERPRMWM
eukprot:2480466-Rhodomonas_salina.2